MSLLLVAVEGSSSSFVGVVLFDDGCCIMVSTGGGEFGFVLRCVTMLFDDSRLLCGGFLV